MVESTCNEQHKIKDKAYSTMFLNPLYALEFRSEGLNGEKISDFAIES